VGRIGAGLCCGLIPVSCSHASHGPDATVIGASHKMRDGQCREFTLMDAMTLVAATALGCGLIKSSRMDVPSLFAPDPHYRPFPVGYISGVASTMTWTVVPFLASWSLGLLLLRMRRPRPERRRLFRQPGVVAMSAATLAVAAEYHWLVGCSVHRPQGSGSSSRSAAGCTSVPSPSRAHG
jgi:hypothetical protein